MRIFDIVLYTCSLASLLQCSQYGLNAVREDSLPSDSAQMVVQNTPEAIAELLVKDLKGKGMLLERYTKEEAIVIEQNWVRSDSLRYYYVEFDERKRHLSEWKAKWTLKRNNHSRATHLKVEVFELVFSGDDQELSRNPEPDPKSQLWFATEPDSIRAKLLLKTFMNQHFPGYPLPRHIAEFKTPNPFLLPPKSSESQRHRSPKIKRPGTAFESDAG